jgi:hypothetical protein
VPQNQQLWFGDLGLKITTAVSWFGPQNHMEKGAVKLVVFNGDDFDYWKNWTHNYLLSQGHAIWERHT